MSARAQTVAELLDMEGLCPLWAAEIDSLDSQIVTLELRRSELTRIAEALLARVDDPEILAAIAAGEIPEGAATTSGEIVRVNNIRKLQNRSLVNFTKLITAMRSVYDGLQCDQL